MIVFRVDANEQVATGHLMRTLSIASACRKRGLTCEFWLAEEKETERIAKAGGLIPPDSAPSHSRNPQPASPPAVPVTAAS